MLIISDTHFNIIEKSGQVLDRPIIVKGGALVQSGAPRSKAYARKRATLAFRCGVSAGEALVQSQAPQS